MVELCVPSSVMKFGAQYNRKRLRGLLPYIDVLCGK